jgi:hypothetical protein
MDERIEAFLTDVLSLEGEEANAVREAVRITLTDYEQVFRAQEVNKRMKERAAHACRALCRARVVEEMPVAQGNDDRRTLKAGAQRHRRAALSITGDTPYGSLLARCRSLL